MQLLSAGFLTLISLTTAQDLATALQAYPEASTFATRISDLAEDLNTSNGNQYTLLIPSNQAFRNFETAKGQSIASLPQDQRRTYLRYHVLVGSLSSSNFSAPQGLTVPTLLKGSQYNNRTAGSALLSKFGTNANGQVLHISKMNSASASRKFRVRQAGSNGLVVQGGLAANTTLSSIDGKWSGGNFQIVNQVLEPPVSCSRTIRSLQAAQISAFDSALNKTAFWPQLDRTPNVTCLVPDTAAFAKAGNPQTALSQSDLRAAIEQHTITSGPIYSDLVSDGATFKSMNGLTIRVSVNGSGIWFNDGKAVLSNVMTNNGLVYVLDKMMSPVAGEKVPTSASNSTTATASKPSAAAGMMHLLKQSYFAVAIGFVGAFLL